VVVADSMWETMVLNVISQPASVVIELNAIIEIHKYKGHHFILMTMEVHDTPKHDMDHFIRECAHLFHDKRLKGHSSLYFCI
jgi:hypothetical protein